MTEDTFVRQTCKKLSHRLGLKLSYVYFILTSWTHGYTEDLEDCKKHLGGDKISECLLRWEHITAGKDIKVFMPGMKRRTDDQENKETTGTCEGVDVCPPRGPISHP